MPTATIISTKEKARVGAGRAAPLGQAKGKALRQAGGLLLGEPGLKT
jgi:hypothetical protein